MKRNYYSPELNLVNFVTIEVLSASNPFVEKEIPFDINKWGTGIELL